MTIPFDKEYRIRYYLGELASYYKDVQKPPQTCSKPLSRDREMPDLREVVVHYHLLYFNSLNHMNKTLKQYCKEMCILLEEAGITPLEKNKLIQVAIGDNSQAANWYTFSKTRPIDCMKIVLLNLNYNRHWGDFPNVNKYDIPFEKKKNAVVWRGCSTGGKRHQLRDILVRRFQNHPQQDLYNIRYNKLVQGYQNTNNQYILQTMSMQDQLKYKFIISIEGNDVATNLKWLMYSNSVVFMPKPKMVSWFMEDHLIPFIHYIELKDDFSDLEEKYNWCMEHLDECEKIRDASTQYVKQFFNKAKEKEITKEVIQTYLRAVQIHPV
jgi:Glycosyl transferase family 90